MALTLLPLIDGRKCFQTVRELRRSEGVVCPRCDLRRVMKGGCDDHKWDASGMCAAAVSVSLTISRKRTSPGITSRCESGLCVSTSWG